MKAYSQVCPVARAASVLSDRWTLLVLRELLMGSRHFNDIHRGLPRMSRTLLSRRLRELTDAGVVLRESNEGRGGYDLTPAGLALRPVIEYLGEWATRWMPDTGEPAIPDPAALMWDIRRCLDPAELPDRALTLLFEFDDVPRSRRQWWLLVDGPDIGLTESDPGLGQDLAVRGSCRALSRVWFGQSDAAKAVAEDRLRLEGDETLERRFHGWLGRSPFVRKT